MDKKIEHFFMTLRALQNSRHDYALTQEDGPALFQLFWFFLGIYVVDFFIGPYFEIAESPIIKAGLESCIYYSSNLGPFQWILVEVVYPDGTFCYVVPTEWLYVLPPGHTVKYFDDEALDWIEFAVMCYYILFRCGA